MTIKKPRPTKKLFTSVQAMEFDVMKNENIRMSKKIKTLEDENKELRKQNRKLKNNLTGIKNLF